MGMKGVVIVQYLATMANRLSGGLLKFPRVWGVKCFKIALQWDHELNIARGEFVTCDLHDHF